LTIVLKNYLVSVTENNVLGLYLITNRLLQSYEPQITLNIIAIESCSDY